MNYAVFEFYRNKNGSNEARQKFFSTKKIAELGEGISSIWDLEQHVLGLTPLEI